MSIEGGEFKQINYPNQEGTRLVTKKSAIKELKASYKSGV